MIVNRLDYQIKGDEYYGIGAQILETGEYDPEDVGLLTGLLLAKRKQGGDGVVAIDCGANIGCHTLAWAQRMRGWGSVIAIEAQERIFYALAGNLALQNCFNARAIWGAASDTNGTIEIPEPDYCKVSSFGSLELKKSANNADIGQPIDYDKPTSSVRMLTIDSLDLPRVDLIKIDIEGMELEALRGATETIKKHKPTLFIEQIKVDKKHLHSMIEAWGYSMREAGMNLVAY